MNLIVPHNGGMPLEIDDLIFMQDSYKECFKAVFGHWSSRRNGYMILSGAIITLIDPNTNEYSISEGYILWNNEIRYLPATRYIGSTPIYITTHDTYLPSGRDTFANGVVRETHQQGWCKIFRPGVDAPPPYQLTIEETNRWSFILLDLIQRGLSMETLVGQDVEGVRHYFQSSDFNSGIQASTNHPPFAVKKNGRVHLYGVVVINTSGAATQTNIQLMTLPSGFRAKTGALESLNYVCAAGDGLCTLNLNNGTFIQLLHRPVAANNSGALISLNGISYEAVP